MAILCYHSVEPGWTSPLALPPEDFARQAAWLARHLRMVPLDRAVEVVDGSGRLPARTAALTFDDGFGALFQHAMPALAHHRLPATVFLVAETLTPGGRAVDWVDDPPPGPIRTLSLEQVLEMQEAGVAFGSHSYSHRDLTSLSEEECERDLRESRLVLEELLGRRVPFLAYPRGRHAEHVRRAAARAGFTHAFSLPEAREPVGPMALPRVGIYPGNGLLTLRAKASRWYLPVRTGPLFPALRMVARGRRPSARHPG
jgi:peptidoglycan/xylan/chitin deacetylase (PgdA/CDA1 family)